MTDDPVARIAANLELALADVKALETPTAPRGHWVDAYSDKDAVGTREAALILDASQATARRRAADRVATKHRIAALVCGSWLFSVSRLLDDIEREESLYARREAETRARKFGLLSDDGDARLVSMTTQLAS